MKLNANKRFTIEEFGEQQRSWIGKLVSPLNAFIEQVLLALSQGLTLKDNLKAQVFDVTVLPGQGYPIKQNYKLNEKPTAVIIGGLRESTGATPADPYSLHWSYTGTNLEVTFIGIDPSKTYYITLVCMV